jgi:hypothetical protein
MQSVSNAAMAVWAAVALLHTEPARAEIPISIELVFAVDTSMSIDGFEFGLLMKGIANAFRTPEIVDLIGQHDGVAVSLFQWSSEVNAQYMIPWHLLKDPASVLAFAAEVEKAERDPNRVFTGIGGAIDFGVRLIAENAFEGRQLKIDVSGDGSNNIGVPPAIPRRAAKALGIEINGLPILTRIVEYSARTSTTAGPMSLGRYQAHTNVDFFDLETYYRENVILGAGAFIEIANDYDDFARAFLRKLRLEITPLPISRAPPASRPLIRLAEKSTLRRMRVSPPGPLSRNLRNFASCIMQNIDRNVSCVQQIKKTL